MDGWMERGGGGKRTVTAPEGERTPFTPPPGPNSSFVFRASSWSTVMRAEAAN